MDTKIAALIALALGIGIGFGLSALSSPAAPAESPLSTTSAEKADDKDSSSDRSGSPSAQANNATPRSEKMHEVEEKKSSPAALRGDISIEDALNRLEAEVTGVDVLPGGEGVITGTVKTEDGEPMAGVLIRATLSENIENYGNSAPTRYDRPPNNLNSNWENVRSTLLWRMNSQANSRDATTDAEGKYTIENLGDVVANLHAYYKGYYITASNTYRVKPGSVRDFTAKPISEVEVDVLLPNGNRAPKATITYSWEREKGGSMRSNNQGWNDAQRILQFTESSISISAEARVDGQSYNSDAIDLELLPGTNPKVVLQLRGKPSINLKITMPWETMSATNMSVLYRKLEDGDVAGLEFLDRKLSKRFRTYRYDGNDTFVIEDDLTPGRWVVGAGSDRRNMEVFDVVDVTDGPANVELKFPEPTRDEYVEVVVYGPDGSLLKEGVYFSTSFRSPSGSSSGGSGRTLIHPSGSFWVPHQDRHGRGSEGGTYSVTATHNSYGSASANYSLSALASVEIRFEKPAELTVNIAGYGKNKDTDNKLSVSLRAAADEHGGSRSTSMVEAVAYRDGYNSDAPSINERGQITKSGFAPGEYKVVLYLQVEEHETIEIASKDVRLVSGSNIATIAIPPLYDLVVIVPEGEKGTQGRLRNADRSSGYFSIEGEIDENGRMTFHSLPAGEYTLRLFQGMRQEMKISVPTAGPVTFEKTLYNAMRVDIEDENGTFAKAGFRTGDKIIGIDGTEFTDANQMQALFMGCMAKEEVTMQVQRGGQNLDIKISLKGMMDNKKAAGVDLDPATRD